MRLHDIENASINFASGSGPYAQYCGNCLFKREANRSIFGVNFNVSKALVNNFGLSIHSLS